VLRRYISRHPEYRRIFIARLRFHDDPKSVTKAQGVTREMNHHERAGLRWLFGLALILLSTFFWFLALRFVSFPFLILTWVLFVGLGRSDIRPSLMTWAVWLVLSFSPIDVFPLPTAGPPRLVPLVMGLPRPETVQRARRGEVILGGCIVSGFEPKYYLVW
jgi:hypothetical protein